MVNGTNLGQLVSISDAYGTLVGAGGNTEYKKVKIMLTGSQQVYDLHQLIAVPDENGEAIDIAKVYFETTPAISRFFDPYSVSGQGTLNLIDEFGLILGLTKLYRLCQNQSYQKALLPPKMGIE